MKKIISLTLFFAIIISVQAQVIDTARFRLEFRPMIINSQKINQPAVINDTVTGEVDFSYTITPQEVDIVFEPSQVKPMKLAPDVMKRYYRNFLKVGFGYPVTPLFDLYIHNPDNNKFSYGLGVHHFSAWAPQIGEKMKKYAYYPTSDTRVNAFFNRFFKNQTLYSSIGYTHKYANLYGYNSDTVSQYLDNYEDYYEKTYRDSINNSFHHAKAEIGLRSNYVLEDRKLKQDVRLKYDFIRTYKKDMENHIGLDSYLAYDSRFMKISGSQNYRLDFDLDYYNNRWNDSIVDSLGARRRVDNSFKMELKPTVNFTLGEYHFMFGVGLPVATALGKTYVPIYPVAEVQLGLVPGILSFYFGIDGDVKYNSLQNLLYDNPFVKPQLDSLKFSRSQIVLRAGVKGNLVKKLNYHISARYAFVKDDLFYVIDTNALLKNQFDVMYRDVNTLNVCVNLNWEVMSKLYLNLEGNYWGNFFDRVTDSVEERAWYRPTWEVKFNGKYFYNNKMAFNLNCNLQFGRWANVPDFETNVFTAQKMKPLIDIGVGFEYFFSNRFTAFANINNLACQNYARYYDFKSNGINVLVGITYSFGDESLKRKK
ncbi:hypothetical protein LJC53_04220 [Bacteroidales bacterium OttesenSCG-928-C03]|nr:hypothetical protein [Bacteroidales bacterium OttesenSCG-928-E04]MDL2308771.1 hypothetical protein [Bacteroidales bacterium OttesenSCG-928-C03]MDL2326095.1 hypothetical protein [Bacteroidales bacterium OttesenSCG-928-A14]